MELTFLELKKRDVINVVDGRRLGRIVDLKLDFPEGVLSGIFVPNYKGHGLFSFFNKEMLFIPEENIIKIGGDVILVDIKCGDVCDKSVKVGGKKVPPKPCPPPKNHQCNPSHCPPQQFCGQQDCPIDLSGICDSNGRINLDDY